MIPRDGPPLSLRFAWAVVLLAHVALAGGALWFLPQGFPVFHRRFVLNTIGPTCIGVGALALGIGLVFAPRAGARFLPAIPAFWAAGALGLLFVFPETGAAAARPIALVALVTSALAVFTCWKRALGEWLPAALLGAASGLAIACAERPATPTTQPSRQAPPRHESQPGKAAPSQLEVVRDLAIESSTLAVTWRGSHASISIAPVLDFDRTPPDGFWSIFTDSVGPEVRVASATRAPDSLALWAPDGIQRLFVQRKTGSVELEAWTLLDRATYSHLNSFATVTVSGHRRLALRFSACPAALIAFTHADYPTGAAARFAYVDAARRFHVVQGADAEKGPFTSLAEGVLAADAPLTIDLVELSEGARMFARLEFVDFAGQLSTALSPTAGHGVSENAIEFGLADTDASSPAHLFLTLAGSGVGRGWDSVGHRAGTYRNRVVLYPTEPSPPVPPEAPSDAALTSACTAIANDVAALKPHFTQLAAFEPTRVNIHAGECSIDYQYRTHRSTRRGGWRAQVPEPDPNGVWFHIGIWDPTGESRRAQINTQPAMSVYAFGDKNITVLILDGQKSGRLAKALRLLLGRHGMGELIR